MPNTGCLLLSLICLVLGVLFILFPRVLQEASRTLNRTLTVLDDRLIRYRYLMGLMFVVASYSLFRLSLLL